MGTPTPADQPFFCWLALALIVLILPPLVSRVFGQRSFQGDNSATIAAGRQVHEAQVALDTARVQINRLRNSIRAQLEAEPQWSSVVAQMKRAQADFDAARKAAFSRLDKDPQYAALREERLSARQTLAGANAADSSVSDADIAKATNLVFNDGLKMKKMEDIVLDNDSKYIHAKARVEANRAKLDELDSEASQEVQGRPEYQQLEQQLEQATQQLTQAREQLAQAAQAERQQREQAEKSREQQHSFGP